LLQQEYLVVQLKSDIDTLYEQGYDHMYIQIGNICVMYVFKKMLTLIHLL